VYHQPSIVNMDAGAIRGYGEAGHQPGPTVSEYRAAVRAALIGILVGAALPGGTAAQEHAPGVEAAAYRPGPLPDRIILTWDDDPSTTQSVTWRSAAGDYQSGAQITRHTAGLEFLRGTRVVAATSEEIETDLGRARYNTARFTGLEPSTRYAYRVGDGEHWSPWQHFTTAAARPARFSFIYLGDAQNHIASLWSRVVREAVRQTPGARFIVHAGDLVDSAESDVEWGQWHQGAGWANGSIPSVPVAGNHEYVNPGDSTQRLSRHWRPQFALPANGPPGLEETAFHLDYQGVRLIVMNSNERHEEQAAWVEGLLRDNPNRWTVIAFHHPLFSAAGGRDYPQLREVWGRIFDRYRVDLVLQGHDHVYARGSLSPDPSGTANAWIAPGATMYVVSVSGAKMYRLQREPWMTRVAEQTQMYQVITVDADRMLVEARTSDGELYDSFELIKQRGRANRQVDRIPPGVAERVRAPRPASP
jgi:3',5'-cyclic AMP phosphodiesterase CpdA